MGPTRVGEPAVATTGEPQEVQGGMVRPTSARRDILFQGLLVAGGTGLLVWPMVANGFPLVFEDSAWYLSPAVGGSTHPLRATGYSFFLALPYKLGGLGAIVLLQAAVTSLLVVRTARAWAGGGLGVPALALLALVLLSGIAKYASWIMADITTGWLFLAGVLWMLPTRLPDRILAAICAGIAVLTHNTHVPQVVAVGSVLALGSLLLLPRGHPGRHRAAVLALAAVAAVPLASIVNRAATGRTEAVRGASPFLLNRFADAGVLRETLDTYCPRRDWTLCDHRERLAVLEGRNEDWLLFRPEWSPLLDELGGWRSREAKDVVTHAFRCCLDSITRGTVVGAWEQFWRVDSDDGLVRNTTGPMANFLQQRSARRAAQLKLSDQGSRRPVRVLVHPFPERPLHAALLAIAVLLACIAGWRGERRAVALAALLLVFLAANAAICAFASTHHDRYQGRVAWLVPLVAVLAAHSAWAPHDRRASTAAEPPDAPPPDSQST